MFKKNETFYPSEIFPTIDFGLVKNDLKDCYRNYKDYGSILMISENSDLMISVTSIGKVQVFYNEPNSKLSETIRCIESIFKKQISDFKILH